MRLNKFGIPQQRPQEAQSGDHCNDQCVFSLKPRRNKGDGLLTIEIICESQEADKAENSPKQSIKKRQGNESKLMADKKRGHKSQAGCSWHKVC